MNTVGVIVDTVTDVSIISEDNIQTNMDLTTEYNSYVIGVGKQDEDLVVLLNLVNVITDVSHKLPTELPS